LTVPIQIMHKRLIPGAQWKWYAVDIGRPLLCTTLIALLGRVLLMTLPPAVPRIAILGVTALAMLSLAAMSVPVTAHWIRGLTHRFRADEA
ncbi:MAG: hypothetical protein M3041_03730, partial [Acidobacteriota bacterium]|nr:hypothetical protein [Acidobacteriota bacterium]